MFKKQNGFVIFSTLVFLLILVLENINDRFWLNDFRVYYGAAKAFWHGDVVYAQVFGEDTGLYKYSPELLVLFIPLALLPYKLAAVLHFLVSALALMIGFRLALRLVEEKFDLQFHSSAWIMTCAFFVTLNHVFRELHLGNVNIILVTMLLIAYRLQSLQSWSGAAFLFALALLFKPYFLLVALPFLLRGKWVLARRTLYFLLAALVLFTLMVGPIKSWLMHIAWMEAMTRHSVILESWSTVPAILRILFAWHGSAYVSAGLCFVLFMVFFYLGRRNYRTAFQQAQSEYLQFILLLALIPNLLVTDTEHFLFSFPVIMLLLVFVWRSSKWWLFLFVPIFFLYGGNSPEWLGAELSDKWDRQGVLGISNLLLLGAMLLVTAKFPNLKSERSDRSQ